jgi:Tol biopolymer transport system component
MADLKEVFEMATKQIEPDQDSWKDQERRQRRQARNRKLGAFAAVAVILIAAGVFALTLKHGNGTGLANKGTPSVVPPASMVTPIVLGVDGTVTARLTGLPANARTVSVSPNGQTVVFAVTENGTSQIGTVGIDGTGLTLFPPPSSSRTLGNAFPTPGAMMPAWSPDGSMIAFTQGDLYVMHADGSGRIRLTSGGPGVDLWPSWSPDGATIAYSNSGSTPINSSGFSRTQQIWTVSAGGGTPTQLTLGQGPNDMPAYSPDGATIAFFRQGLLSLMDSDGGHVRPIPSLPHGFNPRWSPDGSKISYVTCCAPYRALDQGPVLRVHLVDVKTGRRSSLPGVVASDVDAPHWMPDGHGLLENR